MPPAPTKKDMMIIDTDYFTKGIKAEALSLLKKLTLFTDNGSQFTRFFENYGIKQHLFTPRYPQGNCQKKASNKIVMDCLKKRLEGAIGKWVNELPEALWAYCIPKGDQLVKSNFPCHMEHKSSFPIVSLSPP
ncbi:hypothetical protein L3X38_037539 [Prunus dulcis]|uniref:Integrase catalytic domain-containing protein n=1 Tax=Prunus dulcis TaxID=3755 RepID=A0AAD4V592_PRUDU|nr:hypothetical protein L3X38_037539 [Prunus dulcis]